MAYLWNKQHNEAVAEIEKAVALIPNNADAQHAPGGSPFNPEKGFHQEPYFPPTCLYLAAGCGHPRWLEKAKANSKETSRLNPALALDSVETKALYRLDVDMGHLHEGLRKAGLR